ncbi:hypothetical protein QQF64_015561 [Cirrhinus molitorella]|uniref:ribonuclease H n=1 Tax=Cirrhinus molitorella TaxID=172907 RepID=A0ABR3NVB7_9TELE
MWLKNREGLDESQQEQFWDLLVDFQHCFAFGEGDVGQTHLVQHEIETGDAMPIRLRPWRLPFAHQDAADKALLHMQRAGTLMRSPGKTCIPCVDESLDLVAGSSWFTSLDLRTGYWQVPLAPDARPKTAFGTSKGLWQFRVLCFGLCNAPATFARLMDRVLSGIPRSECLVYLDDILVHGSSFQSSLEALRRVLDRVSESGLKLHPEKCNFFRREVTFLGHKLYYRRFVQGFSTLAHLLFQLLKKDKFFMWTLVTAPVLAPPDPTLPFILDTDASSVGMGAVLSRVGTGGERVVACYSKTGYMGSGRVQDTQTQTRFLVSLAQPMGVGTVTRGRQGTESWSTQMCSRGAFLGCQQGNTPVCLAVETVSIEDWRRLQEDDADLQSVIQWVQAQQRPPWKEVAIVSLSTKNVWAKFKDLRLQDGVLQREWKDPATGEGRWQVVMSRSLREGVIRAAHGTGPTGRSLAPLQQFPVGGPMQRVGVDILGPFPRSESNRGGAAAALASASSTGIPTPEGEAGLQPNTASPLALPSATTSVLELEPLHLHSPVTVTQEIQTLPQRVRRPPGRFRDFVRSLEKGFKGVGVVLKNESAHSCLWVEFFGEEV